MAVQCLAPCVMGDLLGFDSTAGTASAALDPWDGDNSDGYVLRVNPATTGTGYAALGGLSAASGLTTSLNAATAYYSFGFGYATKPASGSEQILRAMNFASGSKGTVRLTSAGVLALYDTAAALVATGTTVLDPATWYRIDLMLGTETGSANNDAAYDLRIDGVTEFGGVGNFSEHNNINVRLGKAQNSSSQTVDFYYRDMRSSTTGFPDVASRQRVLLPDGAGTYSGATAGTYADVDELPSNGDTSYLSFVSNTNPHSATLQACAARGISGTISAIMPFGQGRDTAGVAVGHRGFIRGGTTDTYSDSGSGGDLPTTYRAFGMKVFEADPTDAAAWTTAKLDALEVGCSMGASNATEQRVTLLGVVVEFVPGSDGARRQPCFGLPGLRG
jgi:hypothetical protein